MQVGIRPHQCRTFRPQLQAVRPSWSFASHPVDDCPFLRPPGPFTLHRAATIRELLTAHPCGFLWLLPAYLRFCCPGYGHPSVGCMHYKPKKNKTAMFFLKKAKVFILGADRRSVKVRALLHLIDFYANSQRRRCLLLCPKPNCAKIVLPIKQGGCDGFCFYSWYWCRNH